MAVKSQVHFGCLRHNPNGITSVAVQDRGSRQLALPRRSGVEHAVFGIQTYTGRPPLPSGRLVWCPRNHTSPAKLPAGFQKVRRYGFLSPNSAVSIEAVRWLITLHNGGVFTLLAMLTAPPAEPLSLRCPACGGIMTVLGFAPAPAPAVFDTS